MDLAVLPGGPRTLGAMINVSHLTRRYGPVTAVDDVSFTVEPGQVCGFLGPNGAGKSTTMRCLVGLTTPTSGSATVLGSNYRHLPNPGRQVGIMLDATAQHPGRTGRETLRIASLVQGLDAGRVDSVLEQVGLTSAEARARVRTYSLGMQQRLGIATALLGDPRVLILDEPTNGLDPEGIRWMRDLLRRLADRGDTILLSSHLLHEVEQVADTLVLIGDGRVISSGATEELLDGERSLEELYLSRTDAVARR